MSGVDAVTLVSDPNAKPAEMVDLFHLNGVTYQIPAKPRVSIALKYLWHAKQYGETAATGELLESLLGAEGLQALTEFDDLTPEQFEQIVTAAQTVALGALETNAGEGARGSRK